MLGPILGTYICCFRPNSHISRHSTVDDISRSTRGADPPPREAVGGRYDGKLAITYAVIFVEVLIIIIS